MFERELATTSAYVFTRYKPSASPRIHEPKYTRTYMAGKKHRFLLVALGGIQNMAKCRKLCLDRNRPCTIIIAFLRADAQLFKMLDECIKIRFQFLRERGSEREGGGVGGSEREKKGEREREREKKRGEGDRQGGREGERWGGREAGRQGAREREMREREGEREKVR